MFNKFTNKSQEAIINAQIIAQDNGQQHIESVHVLASLLDQSESLVRPIFEKLKIDPEKVEKITLEEIEILPKERALKMENTGMVQGTGEVAMLLERAKKEADKMGDEFISTEHILLALIGIKSKAQEILISFGVEYEQILKILSELRGSQHITDPEPESKFRVLEKYTVNLTEMAKQKKLDPVIGRDEEIRRIMQVLPSPDKK